jgi:hypothetical protein
VAQRKNNSVSGAPEASEAVLDLLIPLCTLFLGEGITIVQLRHLLAVAFVEAAKDIARLRNERLNKSAIAAATGLSRAEVGRLLRDDDAVDDMPGATDAVRRCIEGWRTDPDYWLNSAAPSALSINSDSPSFYQLALKYCSDMPPRAILAEATRRGLVEKSGKNKVKLVDHKRRGKSRAQVLATLIAPIIERACKSGTKIDSPSLNFLTVPIAGERERILLAKGLSASVPQFLNSVAVTSSSVAKNPRKKKKETGYSTVLLAHFEHN